MNVLEWLRTTLIFIVSLFTIVAFLSWISGCSSIEKMRDPDFTVGCLVVESQIKLGYFNQEGGAEICKLKCSKELPDNFSYKYENARTGCNVSINNE